MPENGKGLAKFQSHKVVRAGKIRSLIPPGQIDSANWVLQVQNAEGTQIEIKVPPMVFARGIPNPDDYLVIYEPDGYISWSPRGAFEDGYTKVPGQI